MNYFFGFDIRLAEKIDWMFNINHLFLILVVAGIVISLLFSLHAKTEKGQKVTKLTLASVLFLLEIGRIVYFLLLHKHQGGTSATFNWWWRISFQMCAIMTWTTIITLIVSAFVKNKKSRPLVILENILFGAGMIGGMLTFAYPDCMDSWLPFLHFRNIQTVLVHTLLIFVPLYLVKIKELEIRMKNIWMPALGFLYVGSLSMTTSIISGQNFAFALRCDLLEDIGLNLPFPWHLPVVFAIIFVIPTLIYLGFEIAHIVKNRNNKTEKVKTERNKPMFILSIITFVLAGVQGLVMLLLMGKGIYVPGEKSMLGLLMLLPFIFAVGLIELGFYYEKLSKMENYKEELNKPEYIVSLVFAFILNIAVGGYQLGLLIKEKLKDKEQ